MSSTPSGPSGPGVRQTTLFRALQKGREKKLGRALTEAELSQLEAYCARSAQAGVHLAKERPPHDAARAAVASLPKSLAATLLPPGGPTAHRPNHLPFRPKRDVMRGSRKRLGRAIEDVGVLLRLALRDGRRGPQLPAYARRTSALYIQQDDLDVFIPDGWGGLFPSQAGALARALGLPPKALPLLCLLEWTSSFRPAHSKDRFGCGAGFQVSLDWLARKLDCSRVWVQSLINRLDPFARWRRDCLEAKRNNRRRAKRGQEAVALPEKPVGTPLVHRFRRLKRYEDTCPEAARRRIWVDADGRPHVYVDVRGVLYLTEAGRKCLWRPRARPDATRDVERRGLRARWLLSARLRRGHGLLGGHLVEVLENRSELLSAPGLPENLSPNHSPLKKPPSS